MSSIKEVLLFLGLSLFFGCNKQVNSFDHAKSSVEEKKECSEEEIDSEKIDRIRDQFESGVRTGFIGDVFELERGSENLMIRSGIYAANVYLGVEQFDEELFDSIVKSYEYVLNLANSIPVHNKKICKLRYSIQYNLVQIASDIEYLKSFDFCGGRSSIFLNRIKDEDRGKCKVNSATEKMESLC